MPSSFAFRRALAASTPPLAEMRRLLGVMRDSSHHPEHAPQPTIADLDELLAGVRSAGSRVLQLDIVPRVAKPADDRGEKEFMAMPIVVRAPLLGIIVGLHASASPHRLTPTLENTPHGIFQR
jgi:hypothetical protein